MYYVFILLLVSSIEKLMLSTTSSSSYQVLLVVYLRIKEDSEIESSDEINWRLENFILLHNNIIKTISIIKNKQGY